jgi:hypothetical protein
LMEKVDYVIVVLAEAMRDHNLLRCESNLEGKE